MTNILIVEDNATEQKAREIVKVLNRLKLKEYEIRNTQKCALKHIKDNDVDILITDIQLPHSIDSDTIEIDGGKKLISKALIPNDNILTPKLFIGITSHDESFESCQEYFSNNGISLIRTSEISDKLEPILKNFLIQHRLSTIENVDVLAITALRHTELEAVKSLDIDWDDRSYRLNHYNYWKGSFFDSNGISRSIIATSCFSMGSIASAITTTLFLNRFRPNLVVMTGITAGVKGKVSLGDVVVAESTWNYESGKRTVIENKQVFLQSSYRLNIPQSMKNTILEMSFQSDIFESIYQQCTVVGKPKAPPKLVIGPMVSGSAVIEDTSIVESILSQQERKVVALEMEAYGVAFACDSSAQKPPYLIVKSVCDFANIEKSDDMQEYAAYTSASFAFKYMSEYLE